jgi:hypothetical protein
LGPSTSPCYLLGGVLQFPGASSGQEDMCPLSCPCARYCAADHAAPAIDDRNLAVELHAVLLESAGCPMPPYASKTFDTRGFRQGGLHAAGNFCMTKP